MRIAIDASSLTSEGGGIQTYIRALLDALLALDQENTYALCYRWSRLREWKRFYRPEAPNWRIKMIQEPFNFLFERSIDVFHALGARIPSYRRPSVLVTLHDVFSIVNPHGSRSFQATKLGRYREIAERATLIICVSEHTRKDAETHLGISPDRLRVVHHGVSERFSPADEAACEAVRQKYSLPKRFALSVGVVNRRKNQAAMIKAFPKIAERIPDFHLVVAGRVKHRSTEVTELAKKSPFAARIHFLGHVADEDLPALYSTASVFLFPSRYEGFGMPLLEAMACGAPVVTSSTSSLPEVAGDAALLVDPDDIDGLADAWWSIVSEADRAANLQNRGFARAKAFTWEKTARQTLEIYHEAARRKENYPA